MDSKTELAGLLFVALAATVSGIVSAFTPISAGFLFTAIVAIAVLYGMYRDADAPNPTTNTHSTE